MTRGLLILQLGTPEAPTIPAVRAFLKQFLSDPRVLTLPTWKRWLLLHGIILRTRPQNTAQAYAQIWDKTTGSPLLHVTQSLRQKLTERLAHRYAWIELGMRYGNPSIPSAVQALGRAMVAHLDVLPLYPQYASSSTGTALECALSALSRLTFIPAVRVIPPFYAEPAYLDAVISQLKHPLKPETHVLFSFHGLPESHVRLSPAAFNYRDQCVHTAKALALRLNLPNHRWTLAFQSRLGKEPWIQPYTDEVLIQLAKTGVRDLAVFSPSFTADCLETLEEINLRGREAFLATGGRKFEWVPSLNDSEEWVSAICQILGDPTRT
jgi:ferrochelatase